MLSDWNVDSSVCLWQVLKSETVRQTRSLLLVVLGTVFMIIVLWSEFIICDLLLNKIDMKRPIIEHELL